MQRIFEDPALVLTHEVPMAIPASEPTLVPATVQPTPGNSKEVLNRQDLTPGCRVTLWMPESDTWSEPYTFIGWENGKTMVLEFLAYPESGILKRRFSPTRPMRLLA